jgi:hypothetical protein
MGWVKNAALIADRQTRPKFSSFNLKGSDCPKVSVDGKIILKFMLKIEGMGGD